MLITKHKSVIKFPKHQANRKSKAKNVEAVGAKVVADASVVIAASMNVEACQLQCNKMSYEFEMLHVAYAY